MNQKGFANIILVLVIIVLAGAVGYFAFIKKPVSPASTPTQNQVANNEAATKPFISPSQKIISSDKEIEFTFSAPKEAIQSKIYLSCEPGLSAYFSDNITPLTPTPYPNICNTWKENRWVTVQPDPTLVRNIRDIKFRNAMTQEKVATLQMTVTMPNGSSIKSDLSRIIINPNNQLTCTLINGIVGNILINSPAIFSASGGNGIYSWLAPGGRPSSGTGNQFSTVPPTTGIFTVTVTSKGLSTTCNASVVTP